MNNNVDDNFSESTEILMRSHRILALFGNNLMDKIYFPFSGVRHTRDWGHTTAK